MSAVGRSRVTERCCCGGAAARSRGLSIVEMLIALSISSMLLTATMVALNASFHAYATAAEMASTQSSSRLVMQRLTAMIRSSTLHDAYDPANAAVTLAAPTQPPVQSVGIAMSMPDGQLVRVWWAANAAYGEANLGDLMYKLDANASAPLLERVRCLRTADDRPYLFTLVSRQSEAGLLLSRATVDLTVECGGDATMALESARSAAAPIRLVASTMPRRNVEN